MGLLELMGPLSLAGPVVGLLSHCPAPDGGDLVARHDLSVVFAQRLQHAGMRDLAVRRQGIAGEHRRVSHSESMGRCVAHAHVGINADFRHFRNFSTGNVVLDVPNETFNFARGSVGVTFRF